MPILTNYQDMVFESFKKHDFLRLLRMKGSCHDVLIGEWVRWWLEQNIDGIICNPARESRSGSQSYYSDILFLERFEGNNYYDVKGVAEIENSENKIIDKIHSLASYEKYVKRGSLAYPNLEFAILCYTIKLPNDDLIEKINDMVFQVSEKSNLLWIICEIGKSLCNKQTADYSIYMPNYVKGYDLFYYTRNFSSVILYGIKNAKQIKEIIIPQEKDIKKT